ncbi:MAG TPA: UDP-N-acetylmuramoyl-L-alanyl-D-glutamate--2,6-diaminopimelate ligase [Desulfonatronum sp.]|nr:UDP-N-acetylmuramoyl-L-alanyl-D-glutamate--2,6-diaminopimelate ligase [Desulfonatronum sp.]
MHGLEQERAWQELKAMVAKGLAVRSHSGQVHPGEVFVALPGTQTDGNVHVAEAVSRGAGFVVVGAGQGIRINSRGVLLERPDPREALGELAAAHHGTDLRCPLLVGITGTNGKTTVSYLVEHLLCSAGRNVGVIGTIGAKWSNGAVNSGMTTPDCWTLHAILARMRDSGVDVVSMEVSSHALDQKRAAGLRFEVAALTNVTQDHLDYHKDMERYFQAKAGLFAPGIAGPRFRVINADDPYGQRLLTRWGGLGCSLQRKKRAFGDCLLAEITHCDRRGLGLSMRYGKQAWELNSPLVGRHNAANLLTAQGVGLCLGLGPKDMRALCGFAGVPGRLERISNSHGLDVFVDYAHTPDALDNVLRALRSLDFKRMIVVFGCGGNRDRAKRPLMGRAVARWSDVVVLTSDNPRHEDPEAIMDDAMPGLKGCPRVLREVDRRTAIGLALELMRPGDALLVAGKGHETTQQIGETKKEFHDPTVIRDLLSCA